MTTLDATWSTTIPGLAKAPGAGADGLKPNREAGRDVLRERVGEFVGNVFYGTLMRQMQSSKLKGKYFHGGRGEEVFQGQLNQELATRMGKSVADPIAKKMYEAFARFGRDSAGSEVKLGVAAERSARKANARPTTTVRPLVQNQAFVLARGE
ncbi:MAG: rod-binding protein [Phycisphaerae bacterium]|nr:rod-binding protein [Phycisphaerae bacterium]